MRYSHEMSRSGFLKLGGTIGLGLGVIGLYSMLGIQVSSPVVAQGVIDPSLPSISDKPSIIVAALQRVREGINPINYVDKDKKILQADLKKSIPDLNGEQLPLIVREGPYTNRKELSAEELKKRGIDTSNSKQPRIRVIVRKVIGGTYPTSNKELIIREAGNLWVEIIDEDGGIVGYVAGNFVDILRELQKNKGK